LSREKKEHRGAINKYSYYGVASAPKMNVETPTNFWRLPVEVDGRNASNSKKKTTYLEAAVLNKLSL
jgi:hypothetical protein